MSRIGNKPIILPDSVKLEIAKGKLSFNGPKGNLEVIVPKQISVSQEENKLKFTRENDEKSVKALHGLVRSLAQNAVIGITAGYSKDLELVGTGYRVASQAGNLVLSLGFSHPITVKPVEGVTFAVEGNTKIKVTGIDKQLVGQVAANIRKLRPPEPYKGKGIRLIGEVIRRKPG
ncbi:50S ribosomal protein L6, partial [Candidatus Collierbacteria bacterium]|nr:50S ribosomal protein L6 [Candidatus Collierbacteria bacterium]